MQRAHGPPATGHVPVQLYGRNPVRVRLLSKGATRQEPFFLTEIAYMYSQEDHCSYHKEFHIRNGRTSLAVNHTQEP